jgi:carbamoyltransferase
VPGFVIIWSKNKGDFISMNLSFHNKTNEWRSLVINEWPTHGSYQKKPCIDKYPSLGRQPIVLGIHDGHTASACVLKNGKIVSAVEEERLTRMKNQSGFPLQSILSSLDLAKITIDEVDLVAWGTELMSTGAGTREERKKEYLGQVSLKSRIRSFSSNAIANVAGRQTLQIIRNRLHKKRRAQRLALITGLGINPAKVHFVEHHQCHAATAYYGWGRYDDDILVLTNDGEGDGICASVSVGSKGRLYRLSEVDRVHSFGNLYAMVTFIMGMVPLEHEFKLMGMAPYADGESMQKMKDIFLDIFEDDPDNLLGWRKKPGTRSLVDYKYIRGLLELQRFDNICGGLQQFTEEMMTRWALHAIKKTGIHKVAGAGGVFMNVKANKVLMELPEIEDIFVFPSCSDETISIGAAYQVAADYHISQSESVQVAPIKDLYLGPEYSEKEIKREIDKFDGPVKVARPQDIDRNVANLISNGEVVARFSGREEFGARALGNRSILADSRREESIRVINEMIKQRDFWMPFAMSILPEQADDYLHNDKRIDAPYMILTFDCRKERISEIRACIHPYDSTTRPQVVYNEWNPSYFRILKEYKKLTGVGGILNTSFNLHGYPLVSHPRDALEVVQKSGLVNLAIGPFLIQKK